MPGGIATGPAGGDLAGSTYPNPTLADQVVTSRRVNLTVSQADVSASETTTSTSFTDLATVGPAITLSPGATQDHDIRMSSWIATGAESAYAWVGLSIAGAAVADAINNLIGGQTSYESHERTVVATAQASGSSHSMKYKVNSNTGTYVARRLIGVAI